jgi:hypothetical protein
LNPKIFETLVFQVHQEEKQSAWNGATFYRLFSNVMGKLKQSILHLQNPSIVEFGCTSINLVEGVTISNTLVSEIDQWLDAFLNKESQKITEFFDRVKAIQMTIFSN